MKLSTRFVNLCLLMLLFTGCAPVSPQATGLSAVTEQPSLTLKPILRLPSYTPSPTAQPTATHEPTATITLTPTITPTFPTLTTPIPNDSGLTVEENEITGEIGLELLTFQPVYGSQWAVMNRNAQAKQVFAYAPPAFAQDHDAMICNTEKNQYRAIKTAGSVTVERDGVPIFHAPAGEISPIETLRHLWADEEHWVLEIAFVTNKTEGSGVISKVGQIYQDGVFLNEQYGYQEMFGFQMLAGKPFYFYKKDGKIHVSYNQRDLPVVYDEVPHYLCCSASVLSPVAWQNLIGFFGKRNGVWYYTEIGQL